MPDILVIDDDEDFVRMVGPLLESRGYAVRIARTGAKGMAMCQESAPHGVLLDGLLPDTNGITWLEKFRTMQPDTPVWLVSAFRFAQEAKAHARLTKELGAKVLSKPIDVSVLMSQITAAIISVEDLPELDDAQLLSDLEAEFTAELPGKLAHLQQAVREFAAQPTPQSYSAALMQAHKLHGSAGMYGLNELGERAGLLEKMLREAEPGSANGGMHQLDARTQAMQLVSRLSEP